ncbi:MAG: FTR1 family protein, partial [Candidatus Omnitrophica bacterium]|nr:FTR1 family protein [Candidatus Omnitrophota bacterium]
MSEGTIAATFLIVFREALEASLIVGIIMTALARLSQQRYFPHVIWSSIAAIVGSIAAGFVLASATKSIQGSAEKMIEGLISLAACGVLTYMVFWMAAQARKIKSKIETRIEMAVTQDEYFVIIALPFLSVFREGAETVLFLKAIAIQNSGAVSFWGGVSGLALAVTI